MLKLLTSDISSEWAYGLGGSSKETGMGWVDKRGVDLARQKEDISLDNVSIT